MWVWIPNAVPYFWIHINNLANFLCQYSNLFHCYCAIFSWTFGKFKLIIGILFIYLLLLTMIVSYNFISGIYVAGNFKTFILKINVTFKNNAYINSQWLVIFLSHFFYIKEHFKSYRINTGNGAWMYDVYRNRKL